MIAEDHQFLDRKRSINSTSNKLTKTEMQRNLGMNPLQNKIYKKKSYTFYAMKKKCFNIIFHLKCVKCHVFRQCRITATLKRFVHMVRFWLSPSFFLCSLCGCCSKIVIIVKMILFTRLYLESMMHFV